MKNNIHSKSYIIIAILVGLQFHSLARINSLEHEIEHSRHRLKSNYESLNDKISSIYDDLDKKLEEENSLINRANLDIGSLDPENLSIAIEFTVEPKILDVSTRVYLDFEGELLELERSDLVYRGSKSFKISDKVYPKIIIESDGIKYIEDDERLMLSSLRYEIFPYIYANYSGKSSYRSNNYIMDGSLDVDYKLSKSDITFVDMKYVVKVDDEIIRQIPIKAENKGEGRNIFRLDIDDSYPMEKGQILTLNLIAVDTLGFTHEYLFSQYEAASNMQREPYLEKMSIKAPNGEIVYIFE